MNKLDTLNDWYKQISGFEKLTLSEAQDLLRKANATDDIELKKLYKDKVILGTLYVVYDFINKNDFNYLKSTVYDMDDIISTCNEIWINMIESGKMLSVERFSFAFDHKFYSELTDKLVFNRYLLYENNIVEGS